MVRGLSTEQDLCAKVSLPALETYLDSALVQDFMRQAPWSAKVSLGSSPFFPPPNPTCYKSRSINMKY